MTPDACECGVCVCSQPQARGQYECSLCRRGRHRRERRDEQPPAKEWDHAKMERLAALIEQRKAGA